MGTFFKIMLGISPVLAVVFYFVMQKQEVSDSQIQEKHIEVKMTKNTFNRDFELQLAQFTDNEEDERLHKVFASQHAQKNIDIEEDRRIAEEKRKAMQEKSRQNMLEIENTVNMLSDDLNDQSFKELEKEL